MIVKACAVGIALAAAALLMREMGFRAAPVFAAICFIFVLSFIAENITSLGIDDGILSLIGSAGEEAGAVFKIVGVGYLAGISSDICLELGERSLSKAVSVAGRVEILAISLPFFSRLAEYGAELLL